MVESMPPEGLMALAALGAALLLLGIIHALSHALAAARATRRETARLLNRVEVLTAMMPQPVARPRGVPGPAPSGRPVRTRRVVAGGCGPAPGVASGPPRPQRRIPRG